MKTRSTLLSKATALVLLAILALALSVSVSAAAGSVTLTTTIPETIPLILELQGSGTVEVNGVAYNESGLIQIPRNREFTLLINPKEGYCIRSVIWNGGDITSAATVGSMILPGVGVEIPLCVVFEKVATTPPTGDLFCATRLAIITAISLLSFVATIFLRKRLYT